MTINPEALQAIFDRIEAGKRLGKQELQILLEAARLQQVTIATGDRAIAIGGSADGAVIVTGDRNIVISNADAEAVRELLGKRPRPEILLLKAVKSEVASRLKHSLQNAVLIQLTVEEQPEQVSYPWEADIKTGNKSPEKLPADWDILEIFDQIQGKLLILGEPGVGKTTTMLVLAQKLCERAEREGDFPLPVLFNLSTWQNNNQSIKDWLSMELNLKYGVRRDISQKLIRDKKLVPMLDGLDELSEVRQELCVEKINAFLRSDIRSEYLLVCSRQEEYDNYSKNLELNGAICLKQLNDLQIESYLHSLRKDKLWRLTKQYLKLLSLARTPFFLNIIILLEGEILAKKLALDLSSEKLIWNLLDAYIERMLKRRTNSLSCINQSALDSSKSRFYMAWLARQLQKESQTELLIENIQASWLESETQEDLYKRAVRYAIWISVIVIGGYIYSLINIGASVAISSTLHIDPDFMRKWDFGTALWFTVLFLLASGKRKNLYVLRERESIRWTWRRARWGLLILVVWLPITMVYIKAFFQFQNTLLLLTWGLFLLLSLSIILVFSGLNGAEVEQKKLPNQGIRRAARNSAIFAGLSFLLLGLVNITNTWNALVFSVSPSSIEQQTLISKLLDVRLALPIIMGLNGGLFISLLLTMILSLKFSFICFQHLILRGLLYFKGHLPWNYSRFLDCCTDRLLLQRVGGRYRFIHRLLQEHFAAMPLERE